MARTPNLGLELFAPLGVGWREDATAGALIDYNLMLIDEALRGVIPTLTITATASAPAPLETLMFATDSSIAMPMFVTTDPTTITLFGRLSLGVADSNGTLTALDISGNPTLQSFSYSGGA